MQLSLRMSFQCTVRKAEANPQKSGECGVPKLDPKWAPSLTCADSQFLSKNQHNHCGDFDQGIGRILKGPTRNPDTNDDFLARAPTRKRFLHFTVYECLRHFFRHARVKTRVKNAPTCCLQIFKEAPQDRSRKRSRFLTFRNARVRF